MFITGSWLATNEQFDRNDLRVGYNGVGKGCTLALPDRLSQTPGQRPKQHRNRISLF